MKPRHIPVRTCAGCREEHSKREMVRVVRTENGAVNVDPTGKLNGRGAYLCPRTECWDRALRTGSLAHALKAAISPAERTALELAGESLAAPG